MTTRRQVVAPAVTFVVVAAVAVAAALLVGGDDEPRVLRLADTATAKDAAPSYGGGSTGDSGYRLVGDLPAGTPADAPAWALPGGPGPAGPVARLAEALGLGTPQRAGSGWSAGGAGGLQVSGDAGRAWYFSHCGPDGVVSSDGAVGCAVSRPGSTGSGGSGSGSSGMASPGTVTAEPAPAPDAPVPATGAPAPASPAPPVPPQRTPSEAAVRAAASPILEAVGLVAQSPRVAVFPGGGSVVVDPAVGRLDTAGWATRVDVDQDAKVTGASGWLASPEKADTYPLITARAAFDALPPMPRILSCELAPDGGCKEPAPVDITGAHLGLGVAQLAGGGQVLLPAWLFDVSGSADPVVGVAVDPRYLSTGTDPTAGPSQPSTGAPTPAEPPSSGEPPQPSRSPLAFDSAYRAATADAVVVQYGDSGSCPHQNVTHAVKESADSVVVVLEADTMRPGIACTDDYRAVRVTVRLQAPLGDRTVLDGSSGREVALS